GLIDDCGKIVDEGKAKVGWFDTSTLKEPYRIEGKKTMGLELVEQLGWQVPDAIFYPTGGGTGLIGMLEAFRAGGGVRFLRQKASKDDRCSGRRLRAYCKSFRGGRETRAPLGECADDRLRDSRAAGHR